MSETQRTRTAEAEQAFYATLSGMDEVLINVMNEQINTGELRDYAAAVARVSELAGDAGLTGLHDVGRMYGEVLARWSTADSALDGQAHEALLAWPELIRAYVAAPTDPQAGNALIDHLATPCFEMAGLEQEAPILRAMLQAPASPADLAGLQGSAEPGQFWPQGEGADERAQPRSSIGGASTPMVQALDALRGATHARRAADSGLARDFQIAVDALAGAAADDGWMGLHDACQLIKEALSVLGDWDAPTSEGQARVLKRWPTLVGAYLDWPEQPSAAEALVDALRDPELNLHLADADAEILKFMLIERPDAPTEEKSGWSVDAVECVAEDPFQSARTQPDDAVSMPPATSDSPALTGDGDWNASLVAPDEDRSDAGSTHPWLSETSVDAHAGGAGRFADALTRLYQDEGDAVSAAAQDCVSIELDNEGNEGVEPGEIAPAVAADAFGDSPASIPETLSHQLAVMANAVSQCADEPVAFAACYAEQLDMLAPACAEHEQMGLHDLCLLLQEDLSAPGDAGALSRVQRDALVAWPGVIECFLAEPADPQALVADLRAQGFFHALNAEDWDILQSMFTPDEDGDGVLSDGGFDALVLGAADALDQPETIEHAHEQTAPATLDEDAGGVISDGSFDELVLAAADSLPLNDVNGDEVNEDAQAGIGSGVSEIPPNAAAAPHAAESATDERSDEHLAAVAPRNPVSQHPLPQDPPSYHELPQAALELVELLGSEFAQIREETQNGFAAGPATYAQTIEETTASLERFAGASEAVGLEGLNAVCNGLSANLQLTALDEHNVGELQMARASRALERVADYVAAPGDPMASAALVEELRDSAWPQPIARDEADAIEERLRSPDFAVLEEEKVVRAEHAQSDDVSLTLPDDVDPDLLDGLLQELPAQTAEFSASVQRLSAGGSLTDVETAQRVAHTLKGAGNTVGVRGIAVLTHQLEDILLALSKHETLPGVPLAECLLNAADCLEAMCESMLGVGSAPENAQAVLQDVLDWANRIDRDGVPEPCAPAPVRFVESVTEGVAPPVQLPVEPPMEDVELRPEPALAASGHEHTPPETAQAIVPMLRVPASFVDDLLRLVGETIILTGQVHEGLARGAEQCRAMTGQFELLQRLGLELEQLIDIKNLNFSPRLVTGDGQFDPLEMEQYGELHTVSRRLVEAATDARELGTGIGRQLESLDDMLVNQERLNRETQEAVLRTRMVPVKSVLPRLERSVRQTCRLTGKQAQLLVRGADTLIDSDVLNEIVDPIMHLLRNAIDHGLQAPEQRRAAEKPEQGEITLTFVREGSNVLVRCTDDGAGLDFDAIREGALARGFINAGQDVPDSDLVRMVLRPNFSTRKTATQVSGRGIGLDAVYARVTELGGSLNLQSQLGEGCTVELRLPVTLISTHALLVRAYEQVFAIADRGVEQILHRDSGELRKVGDEQLYHVNEAAYPVRRLSTLLDQERKQPVTEQAVRSVLLAQSEAGVVAVLVDEVIGSRDVVVKGLGQYLPKMRGVMGATILGDGSVTPVLDLPELLRQPYDDALDEEVAHVAAPRAVLPSALVVDDSLSARRSLEQIMQDAGYAVSTARDGLEAASILESDPPDVLVTDLEMPRMNGMELARHVRGRNHIASMPVIMVTSRSTLKHKEQAKAAGVDAYLTKPFSEDELLLHIENLRARA